MLRSSSRLALCLGIGSLSLAMLLAACASDDTGDVPDGPDAGRDASKNKNADGGTEDDDDDTTDPDAGSDDKDKYGPAGEGDVCELNYDCQEGLRCECADGDCACATGPRGTGKNGVDSCPNGNEDCESALCIEEKSDVSTCSDRCENDSDCGGRLPRCLPVFGFSFNLCSPLPSED